jgi:hypothetical protein
MTHPILHLEVWLVTYAKHKIAEAALWLLNHRPSRSAFRVVVYNRPDSAALAQRFIFNGWSVGNRFFGLVGSELAPPPRIVR